MSRHPRTPVRFPRMKVRGKRNRAKLIARIHSKQTMVGMVVGFDPANPHAVTFVAQNPGTHRIELVQWRDGYGRKVPSPSTRAELPKREPAHSVQFKLTGTSRLGDYISDLLSGRERAMDAT